MKRFFMNRYIVCSDIQKTKYSGAYENVEKIIKKAGAGWQLKKIKYFFF